MVRRGFVRGLWLLAFLFSVAHSAPDQQERSADIANQDRRLSDYNSASRSGRVEPADRDTDEKKTEDDKALAKSPSLVESNQPPALRLPLLPPPSYYPDPRPHPTPSPVTEQCLYADQRIYPIDEWGQCQVCICVQRYFPTIRLEPVCGSCLQCGKNYPTENPIVPSTPPPPTPPPTPTPPRCDPLPTNQIYPNPIDPCQVCICKQAEDVFGFLQPPVIECQHNPQCVIPSPRPPPPPAPPAPLPVCNYYPQNVWFPHPQFSCYLCKCDGPSPVNAKPTIDCYPDPACEATPSPYPIPTTPLPIPPPPPPPPPIPPLPPTPVDPLPGPSPHASCRPFTPNKPFQHPWDQCLDCVCTEKAAGDLINVQVNCFTKPECCIVPGPGPAPIYPVPQPIYPQPYYPGASGPSNVNAVAEINGDGQSSANAIVNAEAAAQAAAQAQTAANQAVQANALNHYPYQQLGQSGVASQAIANALAQANANQAQAQAHAQAQAQALASAEANAASQGQLLPTYNYPSAFDPSGAYALPQLPAQYDPYLSSLYSSPNNYYIARSNGGPADAGSQGGLGSALAQANDNEQREVLAVQTQGDASAQRQEAEAQAQVLAQAELALAQANAQSNAGPYPYSYSQPGAPYYTSPNGYGNPQLPYGSPQQSPLIQPDSYYHGGLGGNGQAQSGSQAQSGAQALANALAAQAQASAQANAPYQVPPSYYNLESSPLRIKAASGEGSEMAERDEAQAQADALAQIAAQAAAKADAQDDSFLAQPAVAALKSASPEHAEDGQY